MEEKDIYKIVEEINSKKISNNTKINDIYNLLDEIKLDDEDYKVELKSEIKEEPKTTSLKDFKNKIRPVKRIPFPTKIRDFDKRSECFINILQAADYSDNNEDYIEGHRKALENYYSIASANPKDFNVVEGRVNDELKAFRVSNSSDNYSKGYRDGLEYVKHALRRSKELLSEKLSIVLYKELS